MREKLGWTQERLAEEAKISKGFLSEVEGRGKNISLDLLLRIATALGASVGYLASGEGDQPGERKPVVIPSELSEAAEELHLTYPETRDLLEAYNSIVARRSNRFKGTMSVRDWKNLHEALKSVIRKVYG
ncbi:MAG: helix-turn-helix transcriptional regulator [Acidobacteria bacterium]|nr:helix-turn-helix transcriptional regulator [Acidobacteriota bacterium]